MMNRKRPKMLFDKHPCDIIHGCFKPDIKELDCGHVDKAFEQLRDRLEYDSRYDNILRHHPILLTDTMCFEYYNKEINMKPIKERIQPYFDRGFIPYLYQSSVCCDIQYLTDKPRVIDLPHYQNQFLFSVSNVTADEIFKLIESDITFNKRGRIFKIGYLHKDLPRFHHVCVQHFAFNPLDQYREGLKDIWVDVYK